MSICRATFFPIKGLELNGVDNAEPLLMRARDPLIGLQGFPIVSTIVS